MPRRFHAGLYAQSSTSSASKAATIKNSAQGNSVRERSRMRAPLAFVQVGIERQQFKRMQV
ncbi:MAG: hypothetical protein HS116_18970 [Planctomycetes bacterium]|nr:hypothetical protein [Planctomycetota bacterium]